MRAVAGEGWSPGTVRMGWDEGRGALYERPAPGYRWGGWYLSGVDSLILDEGKPGRFFYEVDLDHVTTSIDVLDVLCQVGGKSWATREIAADLLAALACCVDPVRSLQGLCWDDRARMAQGAP